MPLEVKTVNIMIADDKLNIRYMNSAMKQMLKEAESDLKKELPRFDFDRLSRRPAPTLWRLRRPKAIVSGANSKRFNECRPFAPAYLHMHNIFS